MEAEEVDAVLQREDLRLFVQPQAEGRDVRLDLFEDAPELQLVAVDDVKVVHVSAVHEAEVIAQPVVELVQIEQGEQLARLVADWYARIRRAVDDDPQQPLDEVAQLSVVDDAERLAGGLVAVGMEQGVKEL